MTDDDRARLERAREHPVCVEALGREATDYTLPALLLGLFYLAVPLLFVVPMVVFPASGVDMAVLVGVTGAYMLWAVPFLIVTLRLRHLRTLPAVNLLGVVAGTTGRRPGTWVQLERLDGEPVELRLRMRAYLESTGGALAAGTIGVALCKGDQLVEWVKVPDVPPEAPDAMN